MKLLHIWSIAMTTVFFGASSASESSAQQSSNLIQRILADSLGYRRSTNSESYGSDATVASSLLPRIMLNLSNDYDYILSHDPKKQQHHHVRRGAPKYPRKKTKFVRGTQNPLSRRLAVCGFITKLDRIGHNPRFGCPKHTMSARRW